MTIAKKLERLKKEMSDLENQAHREQGSIDSELELLRQEIGDPSLPDDDVEKTAKSLIDDLEKMKDEANKSLEKKLVEIEEMATKLGIVL